MTVAITNSAVANRNIETGEETKFSADGDTPETTMSETIKSMVSNNGDSGISSKIATGDLAEDATKVSDSSLSEPSSPPKKSSGKSGENKGKNGAAAAAAAAAKRKLGRRGDPRMHRAVAARLNNPQISLLDALLEGGFEFPNISEDKDKPGGLNGQIADSDNVQLCQRKNQLSRRLRLARQLPNNQNQAGQGQTDKGDDEDVLSIEENTALTTGRKRNEKGGKNRRLSQSNVNKDDGSTKRKNSGSSQGSNDHEDGSRGARKKPSILNPQSNYSNSLPQSTSTNSLNSLLPSGYGRSSFSMGSLNPSSGEILSSLKASAGLPSSMSAVALQHQHLLLQRQAELQGSSQLNLSGHGTRFSGTGNMGDINGNVNPDSSLFMTPSSALSDIESAIRHQQEMARIVATAKIFANSARKGSNLRRNSYSGLRHSLTGGVLNGDLMDQSHIIDDESFVHFDGNDDDKHANHRRLSSSRHSTSSAAVAHAHHLHQVGSHPSPSISAPSILRHSLSSGSSQPPGSSGGSLPKTLSALGLTGKTSSIDQAKMNVALDIFRAENASLMKRCLLMAGFEGPQTEECSILYLEFLSNVIKVEEQRLSNLCAFFNSVHGGENSDKERPPSQGSEYAENEGESDAGEADEQDRHHSHDHEHSHAHQRRLSSSKSLSERKGTGSKRRSSDVKIEVKKSSCCDTREAHLGQRINRPGSRHRHGKLCFEGRHIHRLSRKCGHKAIIHKPKNKPAHVDFVVNGKVECYQDSKLFIPDAKAKDATALWPSHYSCEELDCCDDGEHAVSFIIFFFSLCIFLTQTINENEYIGLSALSLILSFSSVSLVFR